MMRRMQPTRLVAPTFAARRWATDACTVRKPHQFEQLFAQESRAYIEELMEMRAAGEEIDRAWAPILDNLASASPDTALVTSFNRAASQGKLSAWDAERIDNLKLAWLVRSYERKGHLVAQLDPLNLNNTKSDANNKTVPVELEPAFYGFSEADLDTKAFDVSFNAEYIGGFCDGADRMSLRQVLGKLNELYCGYIGYEFRHLRDVEMQVWLREQVWQQGRSSAFSDKDVLELIASSEHFERLLHQKFPTMKRFGSEGGEALVAAVAAVLNTSANEGGIDKVLVGMAHRGRLNLLHNCLAKPLPLILNEFGGYMTPGDGTPYGDVKYHLGWKGRVATKSGKEISVSMLPNPSHLETVNPVLAGMVRALNEHSEEKSLGVLLHGDAAFAGQGVCYESMAMADLEAYKSGGIVHIVTNNQIGFTTNPSQSRAALYCSDLAKLNNCPVFHVNADRPLEVVRAAELAAKFRNKFQCDVLIDFVCYRRFGHNETDEPRFTQSHMYKKIDKHPSVFKVFSEQCARDGIATAEEIKATDTQAKQDFRAKWAKWEELTKAGEYVKREYVAPAPQEYPQSPELDALRVTGVDAATVQQVGKELMTTPEGFKAHPTIAQIMAKRAASFETGAGIEWGGAEQLAYATLLKEGRTVRIAGQDIERGTFAHRHYVLHDFDTAKTFCSLKSLPGVDYDKVHMGIQNSFLSEYAAAGFEFGYSCAQQDALVLWEAQFGDFANGAQIVWDCLVSGSETKWKLPSSLVISLPHGFVGQGPEHSSGRLERWLELSFSDDAEVPADLNTDGEPALHAAERRIRDANWQVIIPSTPANYFHALRRQMHRDFRKPLVSMVSKSGLRGLTSEVSEFGPDRFFQHVIDDAAAPAAPAKIVLCGGEIYHTLNAYREKHGVKDVALVRLEQLSPFPWEQAHAVLAKHLAANPGAELIWAQQEPRNMGAWPFLRRRLNNLARHTGRDVAFGTDACKYVGRDAAASPATGYGVVHEVEAAAILAGVFGA